MSGRIPTMPQALSELASRFDGQRVMITGGLGFLGSGLARVLAESGARVVVVDALVPTHGGLRSNLAGARDIEVHIGDTRDQPLMRRLAEGADVVFSLAGQTSHLDSMQDPYSDLEHNCRGPVTVLEAVRGVAPAARVVFASTRQLYGRPRYLPVDEAHPVNPVDVNGIHKAAGEEYHRLYGEVYGLRIAVLRLSNTYGPRMRIRDARQTFLGWWIARLLNDEPIEIFGDGEQRRDLNYLDDVLRAFLLAADLEEALGEVFNLGDQRSVSLRELAQMLIDILGRGEYRLVPFPQDRKAIDIGDYQADFERIRTALGWQPLVALEDGLERTLSFFERQDERHRGEQP
jgi:UDP-glucose 4-epimerase